MSDRAASNPADHAGVRVPPPLIYVVLFGLGLLLLFTFAKGVVWAVSIAPLDAPDEPSHFNYIM